ncbi:MAG: hypothetical protein EXR95_04345 [Gemmatimonadetes bacterium]|nr:hypothetical protein [Gemmatimonadota bacterium]
MSTSPTARTRDRRLALPTLALTFALLGGALDLSAQHTSGHLVVLGGEATAGSVSVSPRHGVVGTELKLVPKGLPANAAVQIMMGALRDGFEVVQTASTDDGGRIRRQDTVRIVVPDWVKNDRPYLVMITDPSYNPLAAADMFHPTSADGMLQRRGTITYQDPTCPMLTAEGGEIYFLVGDPSLLPAGKDWILKGWVAQPGRCVNVTTIHVTNAGPPPE